MHSHDIKSYSKLTKTLSDTLEKHAPLKLKTIRGNQVPFMENYLAYKKVKNKFNSLNKKAKKTYFQEATKMV